MSSQVGSGAYLSRWSDHRIAILVNQGSDPKVPCQALVIPPEYSLSGQGSEQYSHAGRDKKGPLAQQQKL